MSLIQDPLRALRQVRWYLANGQLEKMPTAFALAAGNLLRQLVEQCLFVLAFYGGLPRNRYIRSNGTLRTAGQILNELCSERAGRTYLQIARVLHPCLRRVGQRPATLKRWVDCLNDPSHFANPAQSRRTQEADLGLLASELEAVVDASLFHLVIAASNELRTRGRLRAVLGKGSNHTVAVEHRVTVRPKDIALEQDRLTVKVPMPTIRVVSSESPQPLRASDGLVMVQHQTGPALQAQLVATDGKPIDLTNLESLLQSFGRTTGRRRALFARLRQLGLKVRVRR